MHTNNLQLTTTVFFVFVFYSIYQKKNVPNADGTEYTEAKAVEKQYTWAIKQQPQGSFLKMFNVVQTFISSVILLEMNERALVSIIFVKIQRMPSL